MTLEGRSGVQGQVDTRYKFTSKERESETSYDYFGARYNDARIGRWLSVDPLEEKYPGWSPYHFDGANPIRLQDLNGEEYSDFYDEAGNLVNHVEDGSNATYQQATYYSDKKYYQFAGYDGSQGGSDQVNYESLIQESQNLVVSDRAFSAAGDQTWCNQGFFSIVKSIESASGTTLWPYGADVNANFIAEHIDDPTTGFRSASLQDASLTAENGFLGVATWQNPDPEHSGHVVTFAVGGNIKKGITAQVGTTNHFTKLSGGAFFHSQMNDVQYHILK